MKNFPFTFIVSVNISKNCLQQKYQPCKFQTCIAIIPNNSAQLMRISNRAACKIDRRASEGRYLVRATRIDYNAVSAELCIRCRCRLSREKRMDKGLSHTCTP